MQRPQRQPQQRDLQAASSGGASRRALSLRSSPLAPGALLVLGALQQQGTAGLPPALLADLAEGLETPVQLVYLVTLLSFLVVGAYLVVRQVLIRRELEEAAKVLGERVRTGEAISEVSG